MTLSREVIEVRRRIQRAIDESVYEIAIIQEPGEPGAEKDETKVQFQLREKSSPDKVLATLVESIPTYSSVTHYNDVLAQARSLALARFAVIAQQLQKSLPNSLKCLQVDFNTNVLDFSKKGSKLCPTPPGRNT